MGREVTAILGAELCRRGQGLGDHSALPLEGFHRHSVEATPLGHPAKLFEKLGSLCNVELTPAAEPLLTSAQEVERVWIDFNLRSHRPPGAVPSLRECVPPRALIDQVANPRPREAGVAVEDAVRVDELLWSCEEPDDDLPWRLARFQRRARVRHQKVRHGPIERLEASMEHLGRRVAIDPAQQFKEGAPAQVRSVNGDRGVPPPHLGFGSKRRTAAAESPIHLRRIIGRKDSNPADVDVPDAARTTRRSGDGS